MTALDRFFGPPPTAERLQRDRLARTVNSTELDVAQHEVRTWGETQKLRIDLHAYAQASADAIDIDLNTYDRGMTKAEGDPVKQELVLRYLQEQHDAARRAISRRLGS